MHYLIIIFAFLFYTQTFSTEKVYSGSMYWQTGSNSVIYFHLILDDSVVTILYPVYEYTDDLEIKKISSIQKVTTTDILKNDLNEIIQAKFNSTIYKFNYIDSNINVEISKSTTYQKLIKGNGADKKDELVNVTETTNGVGKLYLTNLSSNNIENNLISQVDSIDEKPRLNSIKLDSNYVEKILPYEDDKVIKRVNKHLHKSNLMFQPIEFFQTYRFTLCYQTAINDSNLFLGGNYFTLKTSSYSNGDKYSITSLNYLALAPLILIGLPYSALVDSTKNIKILPYLAAPLILNAIANPELSYRIFNNLTFSVGVFTDVFWNEKLEIHSEAFIKMDINLNSGFFLGFKSSKAFYNNIPHYPNNWIYYINIGIARLF